MTRAAIGLRLLFALTLLIGVPSLALAEDLPDGEVPETPVPDPDPDFPDPDADLSDDGPAHSANVQQKLAAKFGVDEAHIASLRDENLGYGEIDHTLTLAERMPGGITDENVAHVLEMRQDQGMGWGQIAHAQGTTLGNAKKEFPTQPAVEPPVVEPPPEQPPVTTDTATVQPKSLSRPGKSTVVASSGGGSGKAHGGKGSMKRGGSSNQPGKSMAATSAPTRSGGHAYGRGGSSGGAKIGGGNGKAKGHSK